MPRFLSFLTYFPSREHWPIRYRPEPGYTLGNERQRQDSNLRLVATMALLLPVELRCRVAASGFSRASETACIALVARWCAPVYRSDPAKPGTHSAQTIVIDPGLWPEPCEKRTVSGDGEI